MALGNSSNELVVTIKTGDDQYYKDYIYLNDWTCYVMEQTGRKEQTSIIMSWYFILKG